MNASMNNLSASPSRRRGVAIVYLCVAMTVMIAFCSLGVDVARCQLAKSTLRHTARAAALAAAENLSNGRAAAINAAVAIAANNKCDGTPISLNSSTDIVFVNWVSSGNYTVLNAAQFSQANAVLVYARRIKATSNPISLSFGGVIGMPTCDVQSTAIALRDQQSVTQFVPATSNPWLSGAPTGTLASNPDPGYRGAQVNFQHPWQHDIAGPGGGHAGSGELYGSPIQVNLTLVPGSTISITNVSGNAVNDLTQPNTYTADGSNHGSYPIYHDEAATGSVPSEHGISSINAPLNSMLGVFLTNNLPDNPSTTADTLDFSTQSERDYTSIEPDLQQMFYAGDGQTSSGVQQQVTVPANATRLFLGTMDGHEWSNNLGGYTATITQTSYRIVQ